MTFEHRRLFQDPSSNSVSRVFFDQGQCGFYGVRATTIWVFRQRRGFCGFQRGQCGFSSSVGGSVGSSEDTMWLFGLKFDGPIGVYVKGCEPLVFLEIVMNALSALLH